MMKKKPPSTLGPDGAAGRGPDGRFRRGNRLGKGNPLAGRAAKIRAALLAKLTPAAAGRIADKLLALAEAGDLAAIRELLDRTVGKPTQADVLERLEKLEALLFEETRK